MTEQVPDPATSSRAGHEMQPITLALILSTLRAGRRLILVCTLAVFLLATAVSYLLPNTYTSSATFIPPGSAGSSGFGALIGQISSIGAGSLLGGGKTQGDLFVGILRSRSVLKLMVDHFHLESYYKVKGEASAEGRLLQNSTFNVDLKDSIVTILVNDHDPTVARNLAEGYLWALSQTNAHLALTESSARRAFYEQRLEQEKEQLADAEVALQKSEKQTGLIAPAGQTATQIQTLASLQAQISGRQVQLASLLHSETEGNPDVIQLRKEIATLQGQAHQLENGQGGKEFGRFSSAQVPELETEYIRRSRDVKYHEALFDIISKQYEAARLDEARDDPMQVLDHADLPESPSGPRRKLIMAISLLAGFAFSTAWVLGRTALRRRP
jgi:tyrosine-protein kinase Etk/Wzc